MREFWIDRWKGLLILLVVLGHVVGAGGNLAQDETSTLLLGIRNFIYFICLRFLSLQDYVLTQRQYIMSILEILL